jgi:ABC-type Fe3+/spermidine/putrescine transport system ATPase subunit
LSDRIAVMSDGVIEQLGSPHSIYASPLNRFVADFIGESNLLHARASESGDNAVLDNGQIIPLPQPRAAGSEIGLLIRPEAVDLTRERSNGDGFAGAIEEVVYLGSTQKYFVRLDSGVKLLVRRSYAPQAVAARGDRVVVSWAAQDVHVVKW